ncbi:hypothetical protein TcCL_ESM01671 [Trypanosoma cruzi]|nr:hypothetical protein TcCL_ESM01671 [Trypanosoma cruzi]
MRLPLRRVQRSLCVQQSVTCIFVSAELAGAARRCRRPLIIGLLRPFPSLLGGGSNSSCVNVLVCIGTPNGLSRSRVVAVQLSCSSLHTRSPIGRLLTFSPNFCMLLRGAVEY